MLGIMHIPIKRILINICEVYLTFKSHNYFNLLLVLCPAGSVIQSSARSQQQQFKDSSLCGKSLQGVLWVKIKSIVKEEEAHKTKQNC